MALVDRVASLATRVGQELKALALSKADDSAVVHLSGTETISGTKIFGAPPQVPVGTMVYHPVRRDDARLTDSRTPIAHVHPAGDITSGTFDVARLPVGTSSTTVAAGNDARFTDARTPTAHAGSHASGGSDPVSPGSIGAATAGHSHTVAPITATPTGSYTVNADAGTDWYLTLTADRTITVTGGVDGKMILVDAVASSAQRVLTVSGATPTTGTAATLTIPSGKVGTVGLRRTNGTWRILAQGVDE